MKTISRKEAFELFERIGSLSNITIPNGDTEPDHNGNDVEIMRTILNDAIVYSPSGVQIGGADSKTNAKNAMKYVDDRFSVRSSYYSWASGDYVVVEAEQEQMKFYRRNLEGMQAIQKLIVIDGKFYRIENIALAGHTTIGCCPNEFEVGKVVPRGFLSNYGFKQYRESFKEFLHSCHSEGNFTGRN